VGEMKAKINRDKLNEYLDGRSNKWLHGKFGEYGIDMTYSNLNSLLHNRGNWLLTYAIVIIKILNCKIEDLFYLD
jgi:hypothetical protein